MSFWAAAGRSSTGVDRDPAGWAAVLVLHTHEVIPLVGNTETSLLPCSVGRTVAAGVVWAGSGRRNCTGLTPEVSDTPLGAGEISV